MEVLFCACSATVGKDVQLLKAGFFPATFKRIETLFTFSVLDNFLTDNLECKTTAQQYYAKLQSMTSSMFPDRVPVSLTVMPICNIDLQSQNRYKQLLRASRQWRDLQNRMKSGLGHTSDQASAQDGSIAVFCPACPQPGINLPQDWKRRYTKYVHIVSTPFSSAHAFHRDELVRTFIMDGNFSAEHMRYRTSGKDVALSPGLAFMANPTLYKAHLRSGAEMAQVSLHFFYLALAHIPSAKHVQHIQGHRASKL